MSLSDRLHLAHDNSTDEGESATPPVGEEAVVDHSFTYPISTTAEKPAPDVDTPRTTDLGHVDEPVASTDDDRLADEPLATTSSTDEPSVTADRDDDALVAAPPTDEPFATTATEESVDDKPLDDKPVAATPADERSISSTDIDAAGGDDRVKEPLADDFVTDAPQNPVFVAGTAGTDGVEPPVADTTEPPVADATGTPTAEGTEPPAAGNKTQPSDWREVLMEFVDHPREAVEKADRLVEDAVRSLTEQINREHSGLRDAWRTHGEPSTEDLRKALRGYRDFFEKVLSNH